MGHNGVYQGYTAFLETYPDSAITMVYLGNTETPASETPLQLAVRALVFGDSVPTFSVPPRGGVPPRPVPELASSQFPATVVPGCQTPVKSGLPSAARGTPPGKASGLVYGVSTLGNIAGVMLTAFVLIPHLPVSTLLYLWLGVALLNLTCLILLLRSGATTPSS